MSKFHKSLYNVILYVPLPKMSTFIDCIYFIWYNFLKFMKLEIENNFLVKNNSWKKNAKGIKICQGYACVNVFNLRIRNENNQQTFLKIKEKSNEIIRKKFGFPMPFVNGNL